MAASLEMETPDAPVSKMKLSGMLFTLQGTVYTPPVRVILTFRTCAEVKVACSDNVITANRESHFML